MKKEKGYYTVAEILAMSEKELMACIDESQVVLNKLLTERETMEKAENQNNDVHSPEFLRET